MAEPFLGEIKMFAGNFAPRGWALCDGQLLAISQNQALFSLFGTFYGGDGRTTFGLPDMRGRIPVHEGQGIGLTHRTLGEKAGAEEVSLNQTQIPSHSHIATASTGGNSATPVGDVWGSETQGNAIGYNDAWNAQMASTTIANTGGSQPHTNLMPTLCVNFIVALTGIFPSRS